MNLFSMKLTFLLLLLTALIAGIWGCNKDEDDTRKNSFSYQGQDYELAKGCITYTGMHHSLNNFDLELASSGINFFYDDSTGYTLKEGYGNFVYLSLDDFNTDFTGDFVCDDSGNSDGAPHFEDGAIVMNGNFNNSSWPEDGIGTNILDGGTLSIEKSGEKYKITFNWTSEDDGKTITGYYEGSLVFYGFGNK